MQFLNTPSPMRVTFFKSEDGQRDMAEIKIVGDPNSMIKKVTPDIAGKFPREWEAYQSQHSDVMVEGTPLTEVPGIDRNAAANLKMQGVRVAEELAGLDEAQAKALGLGGITFWKAAKNLIKLKQLEAMQAVMDAHQAKAVEEEAPKRRGRPPKAEAETENAV